MTPAAESTAFGVGMNTRFLAGMSPHRSVNQGPLVLPVGLHRLTLKVAVRLHVKKGMKTGERKILIVDDNIEFAKTVARNLEKEGFLVSIAIDGNTAIQKASI